MQISEKNSDNKDEMNQQKMSTSFGIQSESTEKGENSIVDFTKLLENIIKHRSNNDPLEHYQQDLINLF